MLRTHTCGELNKDQIGQTVTLCGWAAKIRDHGGGKFIDLRDRYGLTQVVIDSTAPPEAMEAVQPVRPEWVIKVTGEVRVRPAGQDNPKITTGEIEIHVTNFEVLNPCKTPPFVPNQKDLPGEDLRLKHRYLDLRRKEMQETLVLRSRIILSLIHI